MKSLFLVMFCLLTAGAVRCGAEENSVIPYEKMYGAFQQAAAVQNKDVRARIAVVPKSTSVKPGDVTFTVRAKAGSQKLDVDPDGEIHGFPMSAGLLKENPPVVTNQPKGTLMLAGGLEAILPEGNTCDYRKLAGWFDAGNAEIKKQAGLLSLVAPSIKSITFEFFSGAGQTLVIAAKAGPKMIKADAEGRIMFTLDRALLAENPSVTFSEHPSKAILDF